MQCEVHENSADAAGHMPFLMDVQSNLLSDLDARVVVPLVRSASFGRPASRLPPVFTVGGQQVVMATHLVAAVRRSTLGARITSPHDHRDVIIGAIDVSWSGV